MKRLILCFCTLLLISNIIIPQKRALTVEDLWAMKRIGNFSVSPDGKTIAFSVTSYDMSTNKSNSDIYLVDNDGNNLSPLKNSDKNESDPVFSPNGNKIAYTLEDQIWICDLNGKNDEQLTDLYSGITGFDFSNDWSKVLFNSSVYPDCNDQECNKQKDKAKDDSKVKASLFKELMYRHWNDWRGEKRSHLYLYDINKKEYSDLMRNSTADCPPIALGSSNDFSFSPDGNEIAFTMNEDKNIETSTNNDVFIIKISDIKAGQKTPYTKISLSKGNDNQPVYSPDGKYIAYLSMERAGFEADKLRLMLYDRASGKTNELTKGFDCSVGKIVWSPGSKSIYFDAGKEENVSLFKVDISNPKVELIYKDHKNSSLLVSADGKKLFFKQQRTHLPDEIFCTDSDGKNLKQITSINKELLDKIEMTEMETFWCKGADGKKIQSILIKPPFFDPTKKYPMIFLIHGGPQGKWEDEFHYRWNYQMFASKGYVIVAPNPRGSTGYGQKFTDEISGDWGGKPYIDLMNCYDYAVKNFKFIDAKNTFAAGASYGGYMINWLEGHTTRFNATVCHDGVFNLESMWGTTEELWFPEWEFGGTPWQNRKVYQKWSPHQYVQNFKTPMLVIHGGKDYRVSEEQAFQLFSSLKRKGVESEFLYFPDESHFVTKPQNSRLWWNSIFNWFERFKK